MNKNVPNLVLLLTMMTIFIGACSSLRKADDTYDSSKRSSRTSTSSKEMALRQDMTSYARKYKGARYKYGGNGPKSFDCSGFTCHVLREFNIDLSRTSGEQAKQGRKISLRSAKPGDLIFFGKGRKVSHVALVTKNTKSGVYVIHSTSSRGVVEENVTNSSYWKSRLLFVRDVFR